MLTAARDMVHPFEVREAPGSGAVYNGGGGFAMGARGLIVLVGMLCLGASAPDLVEMQVAGVLPVRGGGGAVVLIDPTRSKVLPIMVAGTEAFSIRLRLTKRHYPRPLTHDLMESIVHELGGKVVRVQVDEIRGDAFIASVFVQVGERTARIDARPSDGIALALGNGLPVLVAREVLDKAGVSPDALDEPESASPKPSRRGPI
jgi:bifunctional DNase/RNase